MDNVIDEAMFETVGSNDASQEIPQMPIGNEGNFKMPSLEQFLEMLETMDSMSDEEKEQLKSEVLRNSMKGRRLETGFSDYLVFLTMVVIIASVFVFFGYKLYLSLTEKERKREEKLKAKQAKKKK
ncbi:uncharacterized protein LOC129725114 isoform X2 [Wyeomyia smithii]|uniref:uncharacterized protein LOC129725114 isoform X2 n=1 Tax=Wyeomyia smithii TaxID=174621 RepID=UPI002467B381|nr:uncharacterized protein LOC129725114 isoform X2 [Wyeomyia smithii]